MVNQFKTELNPKSRRDEVLGKISKLHEGEALINARIRRLTKKAIAWRKQRETMQEVIDMFESEA
jgi:hypothetical protein